MFTDHNKELISAYVDGELLSPWKEKMEDHLRHSPESHNIYAAYNTLHKVLQKNADNIPAPDFCRSYQTLLQKRTESYQKQPKMSRWMYSSIRVPLPLAAAAILLCMLLPAVLMIFLSSPDLTGTAQTPLKPAISSAIAGKDIQHIPKNRAAPHYSSIGDCIIPNAAFTGTENLFPVASFSWPYNNTEQFPRYRMPVQIPLSGFLLFPQYSLPSIQEYKPASNIK